MQIHLLPEVASPLASVYKVPGELDAEPNVIRTSTPLPVGSLGVLGLMVELVAVVTRAGLDGTLTAGLGHRMSDCCTGDGVDEGSFTAT